jgi:cohesin loading factor subunit SCC2
MVRLRTLRAGLEAASILLHIINSPAIDRRVINEDAIEGAIVLFRHNLSKNVLPALNNVGHIDQKDTRSAAIPTASAKKRRRTSAGGNMQTVIRDMKKVYKHVENTIGMTVLVMERLDTLIQKVPLDDQQILMISAGAMISMEVDPINDKFIKTTHQLHVATLGVVTSIFRKYPRHRQIIVEDLFPIMLRMPTSKKSMRTYPVRCSSVLYPEGLQSLSRSLAPGNVDPHYIQTISAVVLSLVQSSVTRPTVEEAVTGVLPDVSTAQTVPPKIHSGLTDCKATSDLFVKHLIQRCAKKGEDGGASEFRPILSNLIDDLLLVVLVPEYPAAEMILMSIANLISADMVKATQSKMIQNIEATYLSTAFDALGKICAAEARILKSNKDKPVRHSATTRQPEEKHVECYCQLPEFKESSLMLNCDRCYCWFHGNCVGLSRETVPSQWHCDACQLSRIVEFERDRNTNMGELGCPSGLIDQAYCMRRLLIDYLSIVSRKTGMLRVRDAYEFHLTRWIGELSPDDKASEQDPKTHSMPLIARLMEFWDPNESSNINGNGSTLSGMLHCLSDEGRSRIVIHLSSTQSNLMLSFRRQVGLIVKLMESDSSALLRKLAVKAVEKVSRKSRRLQYILDAQS